jgi:hypothetical protein
VSMASVIMFEKVFSLFAALSGSQVPNPLIVPGGIPRSSNLDPRSGRRPLLA